MTCIQWVTPLVEYPERSANILFPGVFSLYWLFSNVQCSMVRGASVLDDQHKRRWLTCLFVEKVWTIMGALVPIIRGISCFRLACHHSNRHMDRKSAHCHQTHINRSLSENDQDQVRVLSRRPTMYRWLAGMIGLEKVYPRLQIFFRSPLLRQRIDTSVVLLTMPRTKNFILHCPLLYYLLFVPESRRGLQMRLKTSGRVKINLSYQFHLNGVKGTRKAFWSGVMRLYDAAIWRRSLHYLSNLRPLWNALASRLGHWPPVPDSNYR